MNLIKNMVKNYLNELAMPSSEHTNSFWYHGTSKEFIDKIIDDKMLKPSERVTKKSRGYMTPVFDKVYLTKDINEAIGYAYFRSEKNAPTYLVMVDGKSLKDIQPDEDVIADLIQTEDTIKGFEWLGQMAKNFEPKLYSKFQHTGNYDLSVFLAKKIVKKLTDSRKIELINKGMKIAHSGGVEISEVWELPPSEKRHDHIVNEDNYKKLGKRIF